GDVAALLVAAVAVDGHQISNADAGPGLDEVRVAAAEGRDAGRVELHLAALHRQEHVAAAAIADDHAVLDAQDLQHELRKEPGNVSSVERAEDAIVGFDNVTRRLETAGQRIGAGIVDPDIAGATEIVELIVARTQRLVAERLRQWIPGAVKDGEAVCRRPLV